MTTDPQTARDNLISYCLAASPNEVTLGRAERLADAYRAAVLAEAAVWFDRYDVDSARELRRMADEEQQPETQDDAEVQFGVPDCTCIPWTRQGGTPRYCGPGDTVDQIGGWERRSDCPHHAPAAVAQPGKEA